MSANKSLPKLNPLKARSTIAMAVTLGALVLPGLFGGLDPDATGAAAGNAASAINELVAIGGMVWLWFERRAPHKRLGL